jgi:anti-sigma factor (TIGR02949 family)
MWCGSVALSETDCDDVLREIEHFLHGELDPARSDALASHLGSCSPCFHRAEFQRKLKEIIRDKCRSEAPRSLMERIRGAIREEPGADHPGR